MLTRKRFQGRSYRRSRRERWLLNRFRHFPSSLGGRGNPHFQRLGFGLASSRDEFSENLQLIHDELRSYWRPELSSYYRWLISRGRSREVSGFEALDSFLER